MSPFLLKMTLPHHPISSPSPATIEDQGTRSPSPNIILRCENDFLSPQKSACDFAPDGEEETEMQKVPDVHKDDLASRRAHRGPVIPKPHQFVPPPVCSKEDRKRWEGIRRSSQKKLQELETRSAAVYLHVVLLIFPTAR